MVRRDRKRYRSIQKRKAKSVKFTDKIHPVKGIVSFTFAMLGILMFLVLSYISYQSKGTAGIGIGLLGVLAFFLSIAGLILALAAMRQKEIHYRFPILGGVLSSILIISYLIMYTLGAIL